jgi:hypothetical protein
MDDAFRETELFAGTEWVRNGIVVDGVLAIGCGVMVGTIPSDGSTVAE